MLHPTRIPTFSFRFSNSFSNKRTKACFKYPSVPSSRFDNVFLRGKSFSHDAFYLKVAPFPQPLFNLLQLQMKQFHSNPRLKDIPPHPSVFSQNLWPQNYFSTIRTSLNQSFQSHVDKFKIKSSGPFGCQKFNSGRKNRKFTKKKRKTSFIDIRDSSPSVRRKRSPSIVPSSHTPRHFSIDSPLQNPIQDVILSPLTQNISFFANSTNSSFSSTGLISNSFETKVPVVPHLCAVIPPSKKNFPNHVQLRIAKRRLNISILSVLLAHGKRGFDYILIPKVAACTMEMPLLCLGLRDALNSLGLWIESPQPWIYNKSSPAHMTVPIQDPIEITARDCDFSWLNERKWYSSQPMYF